MIKNYKGVTFVETIVTIAIFSIVMLGSSIFFVRMWQVNSFTLETGIASFVADRGVEKAGEDIRRARQAENGAFPIVLAEEHSFVFYADYDADGVTERVHYFVQDQKFQVGVTEPNMSGYTAIYPDGDQIITDAADYIVNETEGYATFQYYGEQGKVFSYENSDDFLLSEPVIPSDVKMVKILLFVNPDPVRAPNNVRIQSFVVIRNLTKYDEVPT